MEDSIRIIPFREEYQGQVETCFSSGLTESYKHCSSTIINAQANFVRQKLRKDGDISNSEAFSNDMCNILKSYMTVESDDEARCFWVAVDCEENVVGHVGVIPSTYHFDDNQCLYDEEGITQSNVCELVRMSVHEKVRGRGLGPRLTQTVEHFAAQKGMKKIALSTLAEMDMARKLYEKCGYSLFKQDTLSKEKMADMLGEGEWDELVIVHYAKSLSFA